VSLVFKKRVIGGTTMNKYFYRDDREDEKEKAKREMRRIRKRIRKEGKTKGSLGGYSFERFDANFKKNLSEGF
jgi:hypothetical protein